MKRVADLLNEYPLGLMVVEYDIALFAEYIVERVKLSPSSATPQSS